MKEPLFIINIEQEDSESGTFVPSEENIYSLFFFEHSIQMRQKYLLECYKDDEDKSIGKEIREIDISFFSLKSFISGVEWRKDRNEENVWTLSIFFTDRNRVLEFYSEESVVKAFNKIIKWLDS